MEKSILEQIEDIQKLAKQLEKDSAELSKEIFSSIGKPINENANSTNLE